MFGFQWDMKQLLQCEIVCVNFKEEVLNVFMLVMHK